MSSTPLTRRRLRLRQNLTALRFSQLCTFVSGVAQNFATSRELIRHIFSGF